MVRAAAAFGGGPVDDLVRVFDVAGFAVDAIAAVDVQAWAAMFKVKNFIHTGGTELGAWRAEFFYAAAGADVRLENL